MNPPLPRNCMREQVDLFSWGREQATHGGGVGTVESLIYFLFSELLCMLLIARCSPAACACLSLFCTRTFPSPTPSHTWRLFPSPSTQSCHEFAELRAIETHGYTASKRTITHPAHLHFGNQPITHTGDPAHINSILRVSELRSVITSGAGGLFTAAAKGSGKKRRRKRRTTWYGYAATAAGQNV